MIPTVTLSLPPRVRRRAEAFFQADLASVRLHVGPEAHRLGALAFAWGRHVFLDQAVLGLSQAARLEVLGHELTHVVQQRRGACATAARRRRFDGPEACEEQACDLGRTFARQKDLLPAPRPIARSPLVPQRLVAVAGRTVRQVDDLAPRTQTMVALVDGAERWLSWAIPAPNPYFRFPDEAALVTGVQQGLHGSPLILLPRLRALVHPRKLWTLKEEQLNQLLSYEGDEEDNEVLGTSVRNVLNENGIFTQQNLASGLQFLQQIGTAGLPLFQALSLSDQVALMEVVKTPPTSLALDRTAQASAAAFAAESAQTPREFVDYYAFFFDAAERLATDDDPADLPDTVRGVRDRLIDPVQALLPCPVLERVPTPVEMYALINQWIDRQQLIGFATVPSALRQIAASGLLPAPGEDDGAFRARLRSFIDGVQQFLKYTEPAGRTLSQDGLTYSFPLVAKSATARIDRTDDGLVTLGRYEQAPGAAPSPGTDHPPEGAAPARPNSPTGV